MNTGIILKCFRTPRCCYFYDRSTNAIVQVNEHDYDELLAIEKGELLPQDSPCYSKFNDIGLLQSNKVKEILHPETFNLEHLLNNCMKQLILQVTQQCNLRCHYCAYSGKYYNRQHSNEYMSFETAKRAIDFFLSHSKESPELIFGFYGGEPFLNFELIQECIEYIKAQTVGRECKYSITTNGTILSDEICDFLVNSNITLTVSLDGGKAEHDANRNFRNGNGSFDVIIKNIKNFKTRYPDYFRSHFMINSVMSPRSNLSCVQEYFSSDVFFEDINIMFNNVNASGLKEDDLVMYENDYWIPRKFEYLKLLLAMLGKMDIKKVSKLTSGAKANLERFFGSLQDHQTLSEIEHHGGPCIPGARRLFVTVNGDFFPCERVSEDIKCFCIGNLDDGLNFENIEYILNNGRLSKAECLDCWNLRNCLVCLGQMNSENKVNFSSSEKLAMCNYSKENTLAQLREVCVLKELGYVRDYSREEQMI